MAGAISFPANLPISLMAFFLILVECVPLKTLIFLILYLQFVSLQPGFCAELISTGMDSLIKKGIRLSIEQRYPEAVAIFTSMQHSMPDNPVGYFFHAGVLQTQMTDYEFYDKEDEFLHLLTKTIELAQTKLADDKESAWNYFFLGGAYGYLAIYQGSQNKLLQAFKTSRNSIKALEKAQNIDATLYDLQAGLGTYKYYQSKLSRHLSWLPFIQDGRADGIEMLKTALRKSRYSRYAALSGLCSIYIDNGLFNEGYKLAKNALNQFPKSRLFLWSAAKTAKSLELWNEAAVYYEKILASLSHDQVLFPYNEAICRMNLKEIYHRLGNDSKSDQQCTIILSLDLSDFDRKRLPGEFKKTKDSCRKQVNETAARPSPLHVGDPN